MPFSNASVSVRPCFFGKLANFFGDFHGAESRATHAAEMSGLGSVLRQGFIVKTAGFFSGREKD